MLLSIVLISAILFFYLPSERKLRREIFVLQQSRDSLLYFNLVRKFEIMMKGNNCPSSAMFAEYDSLNKVYLESHYTFSLSKRDYSNCR